MEVFLGLTLLVLDVIAVSECLYSPRASGVKVFWIILIVGIPVLGLLWFYLVQRKKPPLSPVG